MKYYLLFAIIVFASSGCANLPSDVPSGTPVVEVDTWVEAEDGGLVEPMEVSSTGNYIFTPTGTSNDYDGSAYFSFNVEETGKYIIEARVLAENGQSNSFFVGKDTERAQGRTDKIWEVQQSKSWTSDTVNVKGKSGPEVWVLTKGKHTFVFYGREANTKLDKLRLSKFITNVCECTDWVKQGCGSGSCSSKQMLLTRTCPNNCDTTTHCTQDSKCVITTEPTPTCSDKKKNGNEEGVDCGGTFCPSCEKNDGEITDVIFYWDTHYRSARDSDLWPITWAADDNIWTSYGDGSGFPYEYHADSKVSIGFSKLEGIPGTSSFNPVNVWGGYEAIYPAYGEWDCPHRCGKVSSLLSVDGTIYAVYNEWDSKFDEPVHSKRFYLNQKKIMYSKDMGKTWQLTDWHFKTDEDPFFIDRFLNFGKDYEGARDNYVYIYGHDRRSTDAYSDVFLARVPKDKILDKTHYEFFSGTSNSPAWSKNMDDRKKVLYEPKDIGALEVIYNEGLDRYILTGHNTDFMGKWSIYEAPEPWGPWTIVKQYDDWYGYGHVEAGMSHAFPTKWISEDGTEMWMTFSGSDELNSKTGLWDSFNMIKVTFVLDGERGEDEPTDPIDDPTITDTWATQPKNFMATSSGNDVYLTWDWNENAPVDAFKVYRSETGHEPWIRPEGGKFFDPDARSFVDEDLQVGKRYYYLLQAVHGSPEVNSLLSRQRQIFVGGGVPTDIYPNPYNVQSSSKGRSITVTWDFNPGQYEVDGFKLERKYNNGPWDRAPDGKISNPNARTYTDGPNLASGVYVYRVNAFLDGKHKPFSETTAIQINS